MRKIFLIFTMVVLSSCSNNKFTCKAGKGLGCTPARKVYKIIDKGEIKQAIQEREKSKTNRKKTSSLFNAKESNTLRVWIAPQVDDEGNLTQGHYMQLMN
jgi:hypothetical protein